MLLVLGYKYNRYTYMQEINHLNMEIQKINEQIKALTKERNMIIPLSNAQFRNNQISTINTTDDLPSYIVNETTHSEIDIHIIDSEIFELEMQLESKTIQYNNALQLKQFQSSCNHVFIEDLIDLTPDKSKTVEYCVDCFFEK